MNLTRKILFVCDQILRIRNIRSLFHLLFPWPKGEKLLKVSFKGKKYNVKIREGTFDKELLVTILSNYSVYPIPVKLEPKVILDIGANIGMSALYLHGLYSNASIHCFEPLPENVELLKFNTINLKNIYVYNFGLGAKNGVFDYVYSEDSANLAGGGFIDYSLNFIGKRPTILLEMKNANMVLKDLKIDGVDLIKIDTEGSEYDILITLDSEILKETKVILGECHGKNDFKLMDYLSQWFELEFSKLLKQNHFTFLAINKKSTRL
jgi:FkbM family methyltransferase